MLFYINRIGLKNKKSKIEEAAKNLDNDKKNIKHAKEILNDQKIDENEIKFLKKLIYRLEKNLGTYNLDNILKSVLFEEVQKAERKSTELYNRSTLMLILGLLVAIAGIVVFYLTLPEYNVNSEPNNYFALTIRPALILIFVQGISFYLLKQYRSLIDDYKYFHYDYSKKSRLFSIYQLIQDENLNDNEKKFIEVLMSEKADLKIKEEKNVETNSTIVETLKLIIDKLK